MVFNFSSHNNIAVPGGQSGVFRILVNILSGIRSAIIGQSQGIKKIRNSPAVQFQMICKLKMLSHCISDSLGFASVAICS